MHEKRKHYRVAMKEIKESPAEGVYVTSAELRKYGVFAGILFLILTFLAALGQKH